MFYEYERTQPIEFLNIVKSSEIFNLNTKKAYVEGGYSEFYLVDAKKSVSEILYVLL